MNQSKNFNLFLMDGDVTGRIKCTLSNWTGLAFKIPRASLDKCKNRQDLKQSGVYFLFGKNNQDEDEVYIGQAGIRKNGEGVLFRINEHLKDDSYFSEAVILTTQTNSFGPTEISYLENRFTNMAKETERYAVRNGNDPNPGNVTEEKESELEDFIEFSKIVLGVLGYKVFIPYLQSTKREPSVEKEELVLYLSRKTKKSNKQIKAQCKRTNEGFVVLKGSMVEEYDSDSLVNTLKDLRAECRQNGTIINGRLMKNMLFNSPSYAACFILGMSANGKSEWKDGHNRSLNQLETLRGDEIESGVLG